MNIHYVINTEEDGEHRILAHSQAEDMLRLIQDLDSDLRREAKYGEGEPAAAAEKWREYLHRKLDEFNIGLGL